MVLPVPSHVTTMTHHWPAQNSVWRDVSVLRGKLICMEPVLTLLHALVSKSVFPCIVKYVHVLVVDLHLLKQLLIINFVVQCAVLVNLEKCAVL